MPGSRRLTPAHLSAGIAEAASRTSDFGKGFCAISQVVSTAELFFPKSANSNLAVCVEAGVPGRPGMGAGGYSS